MATTKKSGSVPVFDTRGYVRTLVLGGGVAEKQADAHADTLEGGLSGVSTKADIEGVGAELRAEMRLFTKRVDMLERKMDVWFDAIQNQMQAMQDQMRSMQQMMFLGFSLLAAEIVIANLFLWFRL